jgi:hypothetical protein
MMMQPHWTAEFEIDRSHYKNEHHLLVEAVHKKYTV